MSRDPIGERGGVNLYGFLGDDPVNYIDIWGLWPGEHADPPPPGWGFPPIKLPHNPFTRWEFTTPMMKLRYGDPFEELIFVSEPTLYDPVWLFGYTKNTECPKGSCCDKYATGFVFSETVRIYQKYQYQYQYEYVLTVRQRLARSNLENAQRVVSAIDVGDTIIFNAAEGATTIADAGLLISELADEAFKGEYEVSSTDPVLKGTKKVVVGDQYTKRDFGLPEILGPKLVESCVPCPDEGGSRANE